MEHTKVRRTVFVLRTENWHPQSPVDIITITHTYRWNDDLKKAIKDHLTDWARKHTEPIGITWFNLEEYKGVVLNTPGILEIEWPYTNNSIDEVDCDERLL